MGLCKCPKRRVTNQFCFEHRVNVCEHCMVTNHAKCIIQSYLQWLQDSDYNPICELCTKELAIEDCVRLICYHVFHWRCLDQFARQLPPTTAPAGFTCPSCKQGLFPVSNLVSPVADVLREKLAGVNWARAGLGLPLFSEEREPRYADMHKQQSEIESTETVSSNQQPHTPKRNSIPNDKYEPVNNTVQHSIVHLEDSAGAFSRTEIGQNPRRVFQDVDERKELLFDHDENKYKRKSAAEWFVRWWKSAIGLSPRRNSTGRLYRRYLIAIIIAIVVILVIVFSKLGRLATDDDPNFDPLQNPNIHIQSAND